MFWTVFCLLTEMKSFLTTWLDLIRCSRCLRIAVELPSIGVALQVTMICLELLCCTKATCAASYVQTWLISATQNNQHHDCN